MQFTGTYTDLYQLTMGQVYFLQGTGEKKAIFDYFFRKLPFEGGYAIFAGLEILLEVLENIRFNESDIEFLKKQSFNPEYIEYLKDFRFRGSVFSSMEGDIVFPIRPVLSVESNLVEAQLIETILLNLLNYQTLIATKASRIRKSAGKKILIDFGMRRAQGQASYYASRAAIIGGFDSTSNVLAGKDFKVAISGTMAHSYIQSFDDELTAFRYFSETRPEECVLLVDTYNTLRSGLPNAITIAKEMEARGHRLKGIRLDSGDLAYLARESRKILDKAGLYYVKIAASNQLDEFVIRSLLEQGAPIDVFGVGTSLAVGQPDSALDGVYKLAFANDKPRIKLSESPSKVNLPYKKQVHRLSDNTQQLLGADIVSLWDEKDLSIMHHPFNPIQNIRFSRFISEPLLHLVMKKGKRTVPAKSVQEIASYSAERVNQLPEEFKRFEYPHIYKIGLSNRLKEERDNLIASIKNAIQL